MPPVASAPMSNELVDEIISEIRRTGGRMTQSRRMVVEHIVSSGTHHLTAPELIDDLRAVDPDFHESTVYRVLERLTDIGVLEPVQVQSGATVFHLDRKGHTHHHLLCSECGAVVEAGAAAVTALARQVDRDHGFALRVDAPITLVGMCARCRLGPPGG